MRDSSTGLRKVETTSPVCCDPGAIDWNYSRSETIADLGVHVAGLCLGIAAAAVLLALAASHAAIRDLVAASLYALALLLMLTISAAYNLWPVCPAKWRLRRFDHSAIYVLIASTYTPFALDMKAGTIALLVGVWCVAVAGIALKLALPGRLDRFSIVVYVAMGWSGVILLNGTNSPIPSEAFRFLVMGGVLLTIGVIFHVWRTLRFQNAIWHFFVLLGVTCHYAAVLEVVLS
jgi:hemolysin III